MMITKESIQEAHDRIRPYIHRTPVMTSAAIDGMAGASLFFKCENLQKVGAFKARGAMNAILTLSIQELSKGVATHSSGNHAQALARAAKVMGVPSYIVMPSTAPVIKKAGVKGYGGKIFECEPNLASRESTLAEVIGRTGATEIHPFDNYRVMEGQATASKELFEDVPALDYVIVPVGGGGLLSGTAISASSFSKGTLVLAAEPAGADDAFRSMKSGRIEESQANTIADGLLTHLGKKTFPIIRDKVHEVITVTDEEIIAAMRLVWERMKLIVEPSAAVVLAAILKRKDDFRGKRIGLIFSGGNVDLGKVSKMFG